MATYAGKIRKYEARIRKCQELELEPRKSDIKKLLYYVGRAEKKGPEHETKPKDKVRALRTKVTKSTGKILKEALTILAEAQAKAGP